MNISADSFSRIDKLLVDRSGVSPDEAHEHRASRRIALKLGLEIGSSPSLQAAVLTAVRLGRKCFDRKIEVHSSLCVEQVPVLIPFPRECTWRDVLIEAGAELVGRPSDDCLTIVVGTRDDARSGLQLTFDRWTAQVHPLGTADRMLEREGCVLAGALAAALAISEAFLKLFDVVIDASKRTVGISLWRPDLHWSASDALGPQIEFLPADAWLLGLGHLGQAYLWCLSLLPYARPESFNLILNDFELVVRANVDTGMLIDELDIDESKAFAAARFLRRRGFRPRLVERRFQEGITLDRSDPAVALCGFDGRGPREILDQCGFSYVVESGLGGRVADFDSILMHSFPNSTRTAKQIWAQTPSPIDEATVLENQFYAEFERRFRCGHMELAGKSVAVPFVGVTAGAMVIAELLRTLHDGKRFTSIDLKLEDPASLRTSDEGGEHAPTIPYQKIYDN